MATLANKRIYIGRNSNDNRLHIIVTNSDDSELKNVQFGNPNSVSNTVSRTQKSDNGIISHCRIEIDKDGNMRIKNMKDRNITYVDGDQIMERYLEETSLLELGKDRYKIAVNTVLKIARKALGIAEPGGNNVNNGYANQDNHNHQSHIRIPARHLERVWNDYHDGLIELKKKNKRTQTNRMMLMMFGSGFGSLIVGLLTSYQALEPGLVAVFTALPSLVIGMIIFWIMAKDDSIEEEDRINNTFNRDYVCPHCGKPLGRIAYELLPSQMPQCTKCKAEFEF